MELLLITPYIEQRLLTGENNPDCLNKEVIRQKTEADKYNIASTSNLYIYFILKCFQLLEENGVLIAVIPNTWMSSFFALVFKKFLLENFEIKKIIEFDRDIFDNANRGELYCRIN